MKRNFLIISALCLLGAFGCSKKTCTCVDVFGGVQVGIELNAFETCDDLEPMMGTCTEE